MAEDSKIQVFDPAALKKRVSDSVTATFGMMIPETEWQALVEREVKAFFEEPSTPFTIVEQKIAGSYGSRDTVGHELHTKLTPFRALVWKACSDRCMDEIKKALDGDGLKLIVEKEWQYPTNGGSGQEVTKNVVMGEILGKKLEEIAPKMVMSLFRDMFVAAASQAKYELVNEMRAGQSR